MRTIRRRAPRPKTPKTEEHTCNKRPPTKTCDPKRVTSECGLRMTKRQNAPCVIRACSFRRIVGKNRRLVKSRRSPFRDTMRLANGSHCEQRELREHCRFVMQNPVAAPRTEGMNSNQTSDKFGEERFALTLLWELVCVRPHCRIRSAAFSLQEDLAPMPKPLHPWTPRGLHA